MDGLSAATTVISVLQTAWQVISYVKAVKGAGEERRRLLVELVRARSLLATLNDVAEDVMDDEWSQALQNLDGPNGPLFAFKFFLEDIIGEMGIKTAPHQASQTQSMVTKLRRSKIMSCFHGSSSASSSPMTPSKRSEVIEHLPYNHRRTVAAKLDVVMKDLKWPFSQPRLQELLNTLERIKMHFLVALSSDNVRLSKLIRDELQTVHGGILVVSNNVTAIREHQDGSKEWTAEQKLIFQSISTLDFSSRIPPERLEGIKRNADWCLRHVQFRQWLTDGGALLLSGRPGTGKTSICAVVENFLKASGPSSDIFVVALYFSFKDKPENQSLQAVLAFIVEHMLKSRPQLQKHYNKLMLTGEGPLEVVDSLRILHRARQDFQHFYIVLDALDECDQQQAQEVVQKLTILRSPLRIFATARPIFFVHQFSHVFSYEITMSDDMVSHSIEAYIREALVKGPRFPITEALKEQAVHSIIAQSDGVFLVAKLLLDRLCRAMTRKQFQHILEQSPSNLNDTYAECLQQLTEQEERDARLGKRILKELLATDQPIRAEELLDAVADDGVWEVGDRTHVEERINRCLKCCMHLIDRAEDGAIRFSHMAVKDFLEGHGVPD